MHAACGCATSHQPAASQRGQAACMCAAAQVMSAGSAAEAQATGTCGGLPAEMPCTGVGAAPAVPDAGRGLGAPCP